MEERKAQKRNMEATEKETRRPESPPKSRIPPPTNIHKKPASRGKASHNHLLTLAQIRRSLALSKAQQNQLSRVTVVSTTRWLRNREKCSTLNSNHEQQRELLQKIAHSGTLRSLSLIPMINTSKTCSKSLIMLGPELFPK